MIDLEEKYRFSDGTPIRQIFFVYRDGRTRLIGVIMGGTDPIYNQNGFRFYTDTSGWLGLETENTDYVAADGTNVILRIELEVTNAKAVNNRIGTIYAAKNGGSYAVLDASRADGLRTITSSWFTDADVDNSNRLTSSSLTFTGGELDDDGAHGETTAGMDFVGQDHWEIGVCIEIDTVNASSGDYWDIELRDSLGAQIDGYTRRPRITYTSGGTTVSGTATLAATGTVAALAEVTHAAKTTLAATATVAAAGSITGHKIGNAIGFETGGLEEAMSTSGSPLVDATRVRSGTYSLRLNASASYFIDPDPLGLLSNDDYGYMVEFFINFDTLAPSARYSFFIGHSDYPTNVCWPFALALETNGTWDFADVASYLIDNATGLTADTWHKFQIYWEFKNGTADWAVYLDDVLKGSGSSGDFVTGADPSFYGDGAYRFRHDGSNMVDYFVDDFVHKVFCSGISDRYSDLWKISKGYQNTLEDNLDQGSTLDDGQWLDASELPFVDDASPNLATYTAQNDSGYMRTDEGARSGPASDIDGTPVAAKWMWRLEGNEAVSDVSGVYGRYDSGVGDFTSFVTIVAGLTPANFAVISEDVARVPQDTSEYFAVGFRNDDSSAEIYLHEAVAFLLQEYAAGVFGTATLAATASLLALAEVTREASATFAASATLAAVGQVTHDALATLSASATLTAVGEILKSGTATLAASATLTALAKVTHRFSALLAASATVAALAEVTHNASATLASSATVTAVGSVTHLASATLSASATLTAVGTRTGQATATLAATGTLAATAEKTAKASVTLAATATIAALAEVTHDATASMAATATIVAHGTVTTGGVQVYGTATLVATATLSAVGSRIAQATATLEAIATLSASAEVTHNASATLAATATIAAHGTIQGIVEGKATLAASATLLATAEVSHDASAALVASATLTALAEVTCKASATLAATASLSAIGSRTAQAQAALAATASLTASAEVTHSASVTLAATATLTAHGSISGVISGKAMLAATATIGAIAQVTHEASAMLAATATVLASGGVVKSGAATLASQATLGALAEGLRSAFALMQASGSLSASALMTRRAQVTLQGTATIGAVGIMTLRGTITLLAVAMLLADGTLTSEVIDVLETSIKFITAEGTVESVTQEGTVEFVER